MIFPFDELITSARAVGGVAALAVAKMRLVVGSAEISLVRARPRPRDVPVMRIVVMFVVEVGSE